MNIFFLNSGEELRVTLEKAVINQFSNYYERQLEKEELLMHLQKDESHALANDNYDVAEDINSKINKLKLEVKKIRNLFPREDSEVCFHSLILILYHLEHRKHYKM